MGADYSKNTDQQLRNGTYSLVNSTDDAVNSVISLIGGAVDPSQLNLANFAWVGSNKPWGANDYQVEFGSSADHINCAGDPANIIQCATVYDLSSMSFQDGDPYLIKAFNDWKSSLDSPTDGNELNSLYADFQVAEDTEKYLQNPTPINIGIALEPTSAFARGWLATLTQAEALGLNQLPMIISASSANFIEGTSNSFSVVAGGYGVSQFSATGLPVGVNLDPVTGLLTGVPTVPGIYPVLVTANNGVGTFTQQFALTVEQPPTITSAANTTFQVGTSYSFPISVTGYPAPTLSLNGTLPTGCEFYTQNDTISGTPLPGSGGIYPITIIATNGAGTFTQTLTLSVTEAPTITSNNSIQVTSGSMCSVDLSATGYPSPTWNATGLPYGMTLNAQTGVLSGVPESAYMGVFSVVVTAENALGASSQNLTVFVQPENLVFIKGQGGSIPIVGFGSPAPAVSIEGQFPTNVGYSGLSSSFGELVASPSVAGVGTYCLTEAATFGNNTIVLSPFTLTIAETPAITSGSAATFTLGNAGSFTVTTAGFPSPVLSMAGALPPGVTLNSSGVLSGTPTMAGNYNIAIIARNSVGEAVQNFTLTVDSPPAITSAANTTFFVRKNGTFYLTATGFPVPTFSVTGTLPSGLVYNASSNTITGTATTSSVGVYPLTITASNGVGPPVTQNLQLTVGQMPSITSGSAATFTLGNAGSFTVTTAGFPAPVLSTAGALPPGVTLNSSGVLSGTPTMAGVYSFIIIASNAFGSTEQEFTLTIS
jgi:hypothetical protein